MLLILCATLLALTAAMTVTTPRRSRLRAAARRG